MIMMLISPHGRPQLTRLFSCFQRRAVNELSSLTYRTVEFAPDLPELSHTKNPPTHYVLPDLPQRFSAQATQDFIYQTSESTRIFTLAAALYDSPAHLLEAAKLKMPLSIFLVVGGNTQSTESLATSEAIQIIQDANPSQIVWCTWDPNSEPADLLQDKIASGASGIVTQPIFTSVGRENIDEYCATPFQGIDLVIGMAFPRSTKQLLFWSNLFKKPLRPDTDKEFHKTLDMFQATLTNDSASRQAWALEHCNRLLSYEASGLHFMPLGNTPDLIYILQNCNFKPKRKVKK